MLTLSTYFRSSAAYRVRIALNLKGLAWQPEVVWLPAREQAGARYLQTNPQGLVPALIDGEHVIAQSLAIIEYLDETRPGARLLPDDPVGRARARSLAQLVACDIHPLNNLRVLRYLKTDLQQSQDAIDAWYRHWCDEGLAAFERELGNAAAHDFCTGDTPGLADVCLVPQVFNAQRFQVDMSRYPRIMAINTRCLALPPFASAAPGAQPEADDPRLAG